VQCTSHHNGQVGFAAVVVKCPALCRLSLRKLGMTVGKIKRRGVICGFVVEFYWPRVMSSARGSWLGGRIVDNWWR
jgi:hypothetical protein